MRYLILLDLWQLSIFTSIQPACQPKSGLLATKANAGSKAKQYSQTFRAPPSNPRIDRQTVRVMLYSVTLKRSVHPHEGWTSPLDHSIKDLYRAMGLPWREGLHRQIISPFITSPLLVFICCMIPALASRSLFLM